jgi:4'-phosphopantetheinyl transferase
MNESDRVREFFNGVVEDWTPTPAPSSVRMIFAPFSADEEISRVCSTVISDDEKMRSERFLKADHRNHFLQRRAFRRYCAAVALGSPNADLGQIVFDETDEGYPYITEAPILSFGFSSCRFGFLGAWSSTHRIGIDIEDRTQTVESVELARRYFSECETGMVEDAPDSARFFQLWSLKESALKSIGEGLPFGLDAFEFDLSPDPRVSRAPAEYGGAERFEPYIINGNKTCAALVTHFK